MTMTNTNNELTKDTPYLARDYRASVVSTLDKHDCVIEKFDYTPSIQGITYTFRVNQSTEILKIQPLSTNHLSV